MSRFAGQGVKIPHPSEAGRWIYVGKLIGTTFVRNFSFNKARLEVSDCFSFDCRLIPILQKSKTKKIIFSDDVSKQAMGITLAEFVAHHSAQDHGEGRQAYISGQYLKPEKWRKYPWVPDKYFTI